ncbi:MAG: hydrogenase maturation protease [Pontiella sp.]|nr:hydrogenase maturation protease [Pontiella sp.]MBT8045930.1 hydrogenase maturation protease [Pontiella sp.]
MSILVIGYGNPGRLDDGLGPAFAERILPLNLPGVTIESNYQLNVEDAELLSRYDVVIFADASVDCAEPFEFKPLKSNEPMVGFSSHSITAESLLGLSEKLFGAAPKAYAMAMRGYAFNDFGEQLTDQARANLDAAVDYLVGWVNG